MMCGRHIVHHWVNAFSKCKEREVINAVSIFRAWYSFCACTIFPSMNYTFRCSPLFWAASKLPSSRTLEPGVNNFIVCRGRPLSIVIDQGKWLLYVNEYRFQVCGLPGRALMSPVSVSRSFEVTCCLTPSPLA